MLTMKCRCLFKLYFFLDIETRRFLSTWSFADGDLILWSILQTAQCTSFGNITLTRFGMMVMCKWNIGSSLLLLLLRNTCILSMMPTLYPISSYTYIRSIFCIHDNNGWHHVSWWWRLWIIVLLNNGYRRRCRCRSIIRLLRRRWRRSLGTLHASHWRRVHWSFSRKL